MASIESVINRIETYADRLAIEGVEIMKVKCPVGRTGNLKWSIVKTGSGKWNRAVGTDIFYAKYVRDGRGEVTPKGPYKLKWLEYHGSQSSIHQPGGEGLVRAWRSGATRANPFTEETAKELRLKAKSLF